MENEPNGKSVSVEEQNKNIELPMGHRFSKSAIANPTSSADLYRSLNTKTSLVTALRPASAQAAYTENISNSNEIPIQIPGTTINLQIQENSITNPAAIVASSNTQLTESESSSLTSLAGSSLQNPRFIIKIELTKMENGNEPQVASTTQRADADESSVSVVTGEADRRNSSEALTANNSAQFVNLTLNGNFIHLDGRTNDLASLSSSSDSSRRSSQTAGGCASSNNNNITHLSGCFNTLQILEDCDQEHITDSTSECCELRRSDSSLTDTVGCLNAHRRSKAVRTSSSSLDLSRRRCRDALRRILEPSTNKSLNKSKKQNKKHSETTQPQSTSSNTVLPSTSSKAHLTRTASQIQKNTTSTSATSTPSTSTTATMTTQTSSNNIIPIPRTAASSTNTVNGANQVSATIWTPSQNDLIIPITSQSHLVVVQCPPTSVVTLGRNDYNSIRLSSTEIGHTGVSNVNGFISNNVPTESLVKQAHNGPIVHSQVDFVHCLVPDLDKIINSSFYWGKIDRYEAERLLEGKREGTFLLRDSAQEEYLFSVTFRKFGRSLHARIEQSGHKFGFDCHDPSVFTAPTVTGLLQHYKDPACVMFFEPMLAIPLHRKTTFSLQELTRGVIVSNTTYDGINELGLPLRLKAFLKEYYYKQKLRVKPFDKMVYSCT